MKEKDRLKKKKIVISTKEIEKIVFDLYKELKQMFETFSQTRCFLPIKYQRECVIETVFLEQILHFRIQISILNEEKQTVFFKTYAYIEIPSTCSFTPRRFSVTKPYSINKLNVCKTAIIKEIFEHYVSYYNACICL